MVKKHKKQIKSDIPREAGVNEFITRLRKKGIDEGKYKANEIVKKAEEKAKEILKSAEKEAEKIISKADRKATKLEKSAKESIKSAFRDSALELRSALEESFVQQLEKQTKEALSDKKLIKEMILKIVENASKQTEVLLLDPVKDEEKIKLSLYGITKTMLKEGIELKYFCSPDKTGIIVKETKKGIEIDLSDKAISDLLLDNLLPIYREIIEE
jgi:V/A-type H+-transporting ATPase subunit E